MTELKKQVWSRLPPEQGHIALVERGKLKADRRAGKRRHDSVQLMRLYEGESVTGRGLSYGTTDNTSDTPIIGEEPVESTLNIAQSLVDTLDAKIAGLENTKPQIVTAEAKWDTRRQAILADRFIEGQYNEKQGRFQDLWDVFRFALRLGMASTGTAAVKFFSNSKAGRIQAEVNDTLSMWVDTPGSAYDYPSGMGDQTLWDPERLVDFYAEKFKGGVYPDFEGDVFKACVPISKKQLGLQIFNEDQDFFGEDVLRVPVTEGWRFKSSDRPGVYGSSFPGARLPLEWGAYDYEDPPFVFVGGQRSLTSFWHRTLTKPVIAPILRVNEILSSIDRSERLTPKGVIFYDPEEIKKEMLQLGDDHECIPIPGLSAMKGKPVYEAPAPFHPLALELVNFYLNQCYSLPGISEMHAGGDVIKGEWSGAALRIRKQIFSERFSVIQRAYVHATTVEASKQIIRCAKELYDQDKKFASTWRGPGFMKQIDGKVLGILDRCKYEVSTYPVSESKHSPESEMALSQELLSVGIITGDTHLNTLKYFNVLQDAKGNNEAQERLIGLQIDKWLMAEPSEMRGKRFYRGPVRTMNLYAAIIQVNRAYLNAQADDVDERRLVIFARYLKDLQKLEQQAQKMQAQLMAQAGGTATAAAQLGGQQQAPPAPAAMAA